MTYASMNLAGTGMTDLDHFLTSVRAYKEKLSHYLKPKVRGETRRGRSSSSDTSGPLQIGDMPAFQCQDIALSDSLKRIAIDVILMALLTLLFFIGAYVSFLRYDVR